MKTNFKLPKTKMCIVVWYRNNVKNETLIETPPNNEILHNIMLMKHHVGYGEIRSVKSVNGKELVNSMTKVIITK